MPAEQNMFVTKKVTMGNADYFYKASNNKVRKTIKDTFKSLTVLIGKGNIGLHCNI